MKGPIIVKCSYSGKKKFLFYLFSNRVFRIIHVMKGPIIVKCLKLTVISTRFMGGTVNMVLVTSRSWRNGSGFLTFQLTCERFGSTRKKKDVDPDVEPSSRRARKSIKDGCSFELEGIQSGIDRWTMHVKCGEHNHTLPEILKGHSFAGRLTPKQFRKVGRELGAGIKPGDILKSLKLDDPNNVTSMRQIYNAGLKIRMLQAEGRGPLQQALHSLQNRRYYVNVRRCPQSDEISDFFIMHPDSRHLLSLFPYVIIMDTTYKTNE